MGTVCNYLGLTSALISFLFGGTHPGASRTGGTRYVDAIGSGAQDGTSWANAAPNLQNMLNAALPGTEIRVAGGIYKPDSGNGDRTASFQLRDGVSLRGGYAGVGQPDPDLRDPLAYVSTLSGDINLTGQSSDNSHHVVTAQSVGATAILDGFTISNGAADSNFPFDRGGGIYISVASPSITNCIISMNTASSSGGGVDVSSSSSPTFSQCTFDNNSTPGTGGGVNSSGGNSVFTNCLFNNNSADVFGGGVCAINGSLGVTSCNFVSNLAVIAGGGTYIQGAGGAINASKFQSNLVLNTSNTLNDGGGALFIKNVGPMVQGCSFYDNTSSDDGGAVICVTASPMFKNCVFGNNLAADNGGAVFTFGGSANMVNSSMLGNRALDNGGAVFCSNTSMTVGNCTIMKNHANLSSGGINANGGTVTLVNSIDWGNGDASGYIESSQFTSFGSSLNVAYTCMQGWTGLLGGIGNIPVSPQVVDADGADNIAGTPDDNIHLLALSPCINAADPLFVPPPLDTDLDGQPRSMGCRVDVGADEFLTGLPNSGDVNGDGLVNGLDLALFIAAELGTAPPLVFCVADLNADQFVNEFDVPLMVNALLGM